MKILMSALQDSVMFLLLLGAQVIIVSSLAITALWLYFKRLRNDVIVEAGLEEESSSTIAGQTLDEINDVHLALIRDLEAKVVALDKEKLEMMKSGSYQELEAEKQKTEQLKKLNDEIVQKTQGLEARLLEYEVIKDEISNLASIKSENSKLKEVVSELEKQLAKWQSEKTIETKAESKDMLKMEPTQKEVFEPVAQTTTTPDPGIDGLLNEIEALTSENKEPQRKKA